MSRPCQIRIFPSGRTDLNGGALMGCGYACARVCANKGKCCQNRPRNQPRQTPNSNSRNELASGTSATAANVLVVVSACCHMVVIVYLGCACVSVRIRKAFLCWLSSSKDCGSGSAQGFQCFILQKRPKKPSYTNLTNHHPSQCSKGDTSLLPETPEDTYSLGSPQDDDLGCSSLRGLTTQ